jgi:hypothetical protein
MPLLEKLLLYHFCILVFFPPFVSVKRHSTNHYSFLQSQIQGEMERIKLKAVIFQEYLGNKLLQQQSWIFENKANAFKSLFLRNQSQNNGA